MDEVTIYDIAKKANVSPSTVSRVVNNYPHVKKETKAKVLKLLEEMNYVVNNNARSLTTQSTKIVGILVSDIREQYHTYAVYYIEQALSARGYSSLIMNIGANAFYANGADPERLKTSIQSLSQKKIDAAIMVGSLYQSDIVQHAIRTCLPSIPVFMIGARLEGDNIYCILPDNAGGIAKAVKLLYEKGHRNFAFIYNHLTPSVENKLRGFNEGISKYVMKGTKCVICGGTTKEQMLQATIDLVSEHPEVDSIIYSDDHNAIVGLHALYEMGKKVPAEIAVVGVNNSRDAAISNPSLTSVDNKLKDMSITATRNMFAYLDGESIPKVMTIDSEVVERKST